MNEIPNSKKVYDLEDRTYTFAKDAALFCKKIPRTVSNIEYGKQLIRATASVGANYIEANESLSKKDFSFRIKICIKESKESGYWLRLIIETNDESFREEGMSLFDESVELKKIFCSILVEADPSKKLDK